MTYFDIARHLAAYNRLCRTTCNHHCDHFCTAFYVFVKDKANLLILNVFYIKHRSTSQRASGVTIKVLT